MFSKAQMSVLAYPCFCLHLRLASQQLQLATCLQLTECWGAGRHQDEAGEMHRQAYQSPCDTLNSLLDALLAATILRSCRLQPPCITPLVTIMTCLACFAAAIQTQLAAPQKRFRLTANHCVANHWHALPADWMCREEVSQPRNLQGFCSALAAAVQSLMAQSTGYWGTSMTVK